MYTEEVVEDDKVPVVVYVFKHSFRILIVLAIKYIF